MGTTLRDAWIYLENGTFLEAKSFGADDTRYRFYPCLYS